MNTPSCPYSPEDRVAFAYDELQKDRADAFRAHLDTCVSCRESVAELQRAADLCHTVRSATAPEPEWTADLDLGRAGSRRPWWQQSFVWVPIGAAICGSLLWFMVRRFPELSPSPSTSDEITSADRFPATAVQALPIKVVSLGGQAYLRRSDSVASLPVDVRSQIFAGDSIVSAENSWVEMELDDGSRLRLGPESSLRLEMAGHEADRFSLGRGVVACRVNPRLKRSFMIASRQADTRVVGTLFAIRQVKAETLVVGVARGKVELDRSRHSKPTLPVSTGHQVILSVTGELLRSEKLGRGMRNLMGPLLPRHYKPGGKIGGAEVSLKAPPHPPEAEKSKTGSGKGDTVASLVEGVYRDTRWIFDQLRQEMKEGRYKRVLNRLNNYIADPEAPKRSEAVFLKAECLEEMGRTRQAHQTYREYQIQWPAGAHAREALAGQIRTRPLR